MFDTFYSDTHCSLLGIFYKAFRLKCGLVRNSYSSPFRFFELPLGCHAATRYSQLTVKLGDIPNIQRGHLLRIYDNLKILFDHFNLNEHYNTFDFTKNERKFY